MAMKRIVLILNPTSGSSPLATNHDTPEASRDTILAMLRKYQIEPEVAYTTAEDPGTKLARHFATEGAEMVIAAGGDGTIHAVACGLIDTNCTLGIIPMGTMNNIAHSLNIPEDIEKACAVIAQGIPSLIDIGHMNGSIFLEVAGIGLEAALFPAAEEIKSVGFWSTVTGIFKGLVTLFRFRPSRFALSFDGHRIRHFRAVQISICNSPYYGARLQFAPKAVMDDGFLDVLIYKNFSKLEYIFHAISISQGRRTLEPRVTRRKIRTLRVLSEEPVVIHADGNPKGHTPAFIHVQPKALRVQVPIKVAIGPNIIRNNHTKPLLLKKASQARAEERGSLNVT